ncbi:MAG: hypothetical protein WC523_05810 [Patescibacteria group bacterium]|jgi:hypothetical protein
MGANKQIIKLKKDDLKKVLVKGFSQSAWETKKTGRSTKEQIHFSSKKYQRPPKHRRNFRHLEEEF